MKRTAIFAGLIITGVFGMTACPESGNSNTSNTNRASNSNTNTIMTNNANNSITNNSMSSNTNSNGNTAVVENNFYINAAQGGMTEIELSKLALQKSQNTDIKKFANMMVSDHGKADAELKNSGGQKNVKLPTEVNASQKSTIEDLSKLAGAEFDKKYVETMVKDHEKTVKLFEDNTDNPDADVKAFATKTLPTLKSHLQMIKDIQGKMK